MHWLQLLILRWRKWSSSRYQRRSTRSTAFSIYPLPVEVTGKDARTSNPRGVFENVPEIHRAKTSRRACRGASNLIRDERGAEAVYIAKSRMHIAPIAKASVAAMESACTQSIPAMVASLG